ncbi:MAG: hypothetical protein ACRC1T_05395 [Clostridium chrysemydis]|uniref:hypothetical protein n=1 Tax=Clostridium chrysemydis TaxID=2665504 RepID=UPI003F32C8B6
MSRPMIDLLTILPTNKEEIVKDKFIPLMKSIESDMFYDFWNLTDYNKKYYESSYKELITEYMKSDELVRHKRDLSFSDLCDFYNNFLFEYKYFRENLCGKDKDNECEYLNRRVGWYKLKLDIIKDVFEIKYKENK